MSEHLHTEPESKRSALPVLLLGGVLSGIIMSGMVLLYSARTAGGSDAPQVPTPVPDNAREGAPAPDFTGQLVDGTTIRLSDLQGQPVAVNFWATWCGPCRVEMPDLQAAHDAGDVIVLAVNYEEAAPAIQAFMTENDLSFPAIVDEDGDIASLYGVRVFPTTFWIDADGIIVAEHLGPLNSDLMNRYIASLNE